MFLVGSVEFPAHQFSHRIRDWEPYTDSCVGTKCGRRMSCRSINSSWTRSMPRSERPRMPAIHEIRADFDADTIVVYQAYPRFAEAALAAGTLRRSVLLRRMTWIKPSFLWMMERSNWGQKRGRNVFSPSASRRAAGRRRWLRPSSPTPSRASTPARRTGGSSSRRPRVRAVGPGADAAGRGPGVQEHSGRHQPPRH